MTDWEAAKREYVTTSCTYQQIADKYGCSIRSVIRQANKGSWQAERKRYVTDVAQACHKMSVEKTAEKFSDYVSELQEDVVRISRELVGKIDMTLSVNLPFAPKDLKSLSSMLTDLMINLEKMQTWEKDDKEKVTVEFVNMEWDDNAED